MVLGGAAAAGLLWGAGPPVLRQTDFFRVRRVELVGVRYLTPAVVVQGLELAERASVFDDLDVIERRAQALPGIVSAEVGRRLPGTLRVVVRETEPVALVPAAGGMRMLDANGQTLPFDPAVSAPDLPIVGQADSIVVGVLARIQIYDPGLFARIESARRVRDDVIVEWEGRRLWLAANVSPEGIRAVMAVAHDLARQGRDYQELDGRFAGQVVVRWARA